MLLTFDSESSSWALARCKPIRETFLNNFQRSLAVRPGLPKRNKWNEQWAKGFCTNAKKIKI